MAKKTKTELQTIITANINTNTSGDITAADVREVVTDIHDSVNAPITKENSSIYFIGDSITYGANASSPALTNSYGGLVATRNSFTKYNTALGSSNVSDYCYQLLPGYTHTSSGYDNSPSSISTDKIFCLWGDYNGMRDFGNTASYVTHHKNTMRALLAYASVADTYKLFGSSSSVTKSGTWTADTRYGGSLAMKSSTAGDYVTFEAKGDSIYVFMINNSAPGSPYTAGVSGRPIVGGSAFTILVDGTAVGNSDNGSAYGNRLSYNGSDGSLVTMVDYAVWCYRYTGLGDTVHTVKVLIDSIGTPANVSFLCGFGNGDVPYTEDIGPYAILPTTLRPTVAGGASLTTDALINSAMDNFHTAQRDVVDELSGDGLHVVLADTLPYYDRTTAALDNVHPNDTGHAQIASAINYALYGGLTASVKQAAKRGQASSADFSAGGDVGSNGDFDATGNYELYNAGKNTSNFEKFMISWASNIVSLESTRGGTGLARLLRLKACNNASNAFTYFDFTRQGTEPVRLSIDAAPGYVNYIIYKTGALGTAGITNPSGTVVWKENRVTIDTGAGTAGYTIEKINVTETSVGSGENLLVDYQTDSVSKFKIDRLGKMTLFSTVTAGGTTGAQTINKPTGTVNFAAGATSVVVTNSLVTTSSIVLAVIRTNDTTALIKNVVPGSGSFTINMNVAVTAETSVGFIVIN